MAVECKSDNKNKNMASILDGIPRSDGNAIGIFELCQGALKDDPACRACAEAVVSFLELFEAVTVYTDDKSGPLKLKAKSQPAFYFLRSLAAYFRQGFTLATNWERRGASQNCPQNEVLTSGTQLLYLMEHRRTVELGDKTPIRYEHVSQAIIKARLWGRRQDVYLVQYDQDAHQYQFIGGRERSTDSDKLTTMKREIEEELPHSQLVFGRDYELKELISDFEMESLSPTYGAYSHYTFTIYQATIKRRQLVLGPSDKWVTLKELLASETRDNQRISTGYIAALQEQLPGGLEGLHLSLDNVQRRPLLEIIKERRWELVSLAIGIVSIILAVIFFLLKG